MTKINFSPFQKLLVFLVITLPAFSIKAKAQDSFSVQKAFQSCLDHPKVQPLLKAVSFSDYVEVLAIVKNKYVTSEMNLTQFGKAAVVLPDTDLFFHGIEDHVTLSDVRTKKEEITLALIAGAKFTCTYDGNKGKVTGLKKLPAE